MIKILIVDDSHFIHKVLEKIISEKAPDIQIVGSAYNGVEAYNLAGILDIDVILMDIDMPGVNGLTATEKIMEENPKPIIVFSGAAKRIGNLSFKAIELGAVDIIEKPESEHPGELSQIIEQKLLDKIRLFHDFKVIKRIKNKTIKGIIDKKDHLEHLNTKKENLEFVSKTIEQIDYKYPIISIAASTGGPQTLRKICSSLKENFPAPIIILQHMGEGFMENFKDWLGKISTNSVHFAKKGEKPEPGNIYVANSGHHLIITDGKFDYSDEPPVLGIKPCADILFSSLANYYQEKLIGVILTGMGRDGTIGFKDVKKHNGTTIAQDEKSSIIFGMPKSAIDSGYVDKIENLSNISELIYNITLKKIKELNT